MGQFWPQITNKAFGLFLDLNFFIDTQEDKVCLNSDTLSMLVYQKSPTQGISVCLSYKELC